MIYQQIIKPFIASVTGYSASCRYMPTCSQYIKAALSSHGIFKGGILSIKRVLKCNPLSPGGYDPVPPACK